MSRARWDTARMLAMAVLLGLCGHACSTPAPDDRITVHAPSSKSFTTVGIMLDRRCGTLDCHGSSQRNFRLYGQSGMRLKADDLPGALPTTLNELDQNYHAVVGLEPEVITAVVREGGRQPDRLTLLRKARGTEFHLGGRQIFVGDDSDVCITSWLEGATDEAACGRATHEIDPLLDPAP